ncbi:MAG TPA: hypothetical protein VMW27_23500 [Thermoanaerobaculia bacterium]|nr:hypothetical protein [Thermoanaerobaculia bacterium]
MTTLQPKTALVDAHVHVHAAFDPDRFLSGALEGFRRGAAAAGIAAPFTGCLLLAESAGERWFRQAAGSGAAGSWRLEPTAEPESLRARRPDGAELVVIAGRQVRTREGLEVLALATAEDFADGLPLAETLDRVRASGALPVLPWGFGKWWFSRGALVAAELGSGRGELYLGDNAGRPTRFGRPRLFREAAERGVPVLAGSDPLPLAGHGTRAGSYGFLLAGPLDEAQPARSLAALVRRLRAAGAQPRPFGRTSGLLRFCRDQAALRLSRRGGAAPGAVSPVSPGWRP